MNKSSGLGRGLSSLIPPVIKKEILPQDSKVISPDERILQVAPDKIKTNPHQPRSDFSPEALEELTNSIREHGILQPLIVTVADDGYQLIAGERRLRSAQLIGLNTVPVIVRKAEEQEKLELALVENLQRRNLNPIEEAIAFQRLIDEFNLTQEDAAKRVGKSRTVVTNTLRLLSLPTEIQKALIDEKINYSTARVIAGLPSDQRLSFFERILKQDLTTRAIEGQAKMVAVKRHFRKAKDPALKAQEDTLEQALGTKVAIKKSGDGGTVVIDFYSEEELLELIRKITT